MPLDTKPLISIITPSFNSGDFLEEAIRSVIAQDYAPLEHIIIDGRSTDETLEILQRYSQPVAWISEPDKGQADAINKGFRRAQGEIIGWLNADDTYQPGAIRSAVAYLQAHPEVDLVYGNFNFINARSEPTHTQITPEFSLERLLYGDAIIPQAGMFLRRRIIEESGGVNPNLHYTMDWEFTFRIARSHNVQRINEIWGNFRIVEGTKSVQQTERFWPEIIDVVQKFIEKNPSKFTSKITNNALFMNHLLASLEFARAGQVSSVQQYLERAFEICPHPQKHPAVLASALFKTATHPWHSAFQSHPEAQHALDNLSFCLNDSPIKRRIQAHLYLYQALKQGRQGQWRKLSHYLSQAMAPSSYRTFVNWRSIRMMLGAIVK